MQSIEDMCKDYAKDVFSYLLCITYDKEIAEELTQETMYKAIKNIKKYRGACEINIWLCKIARNEWFMYRKKNNKIKTVPIEEAMDIESNTYVEEEIIEKNEREKIYNAIRKLDEETSQIILLRLESDMELKKIGEIFDKNERWARVKYFRGKETIERLNSDNIDIVILDLKMPILDGIEVISKLSEEKRKKYNQSIIVVSGEPDMIVKVREEETVYAYIDKLSSMSEIIEKIDKLVKNKNSRKNVHLLKDEIRKELQELGYNLSHKGTIYLVDAISLIYIKKIEDKLNLKKDIYPILAEKHNRPVYSIKSDIVKATDFMDSTCDLKKKKEYFSFDDNTKLTVKLVIYTVLNNIHKKNTKPKVSTI